MREETLKKIESLDFHQRIYLARAKIDSLVDHCLRQIATFQNRTTLNDPHGLAEKLPRSRATRSFNSLKHDLMMFELIKLQSLWQAPDLDAENLPTVVALLDHKTIRKLINESHERQYAVSSRFGEGYRIRQERRLDTSIKLIGRLETSDPISRIDNFRQKVSHNLKVTRREKSGQSPIQSPSLIEVNRITIATIISVKGLYAGVNGVGFDFREAMSISSRNSTNLWSNLTPDLERIV